jgi:competence ComEA-like helix-hairpin-helix protein
MKPQAHPARTTRLAIAAALALVSAAGLAFTSVLTDRSPLTARGPALATITLPLVNLNTATAGELELLPRIGPTLSARIIEDRDTNGPFEAIEALDRVKGIGPRTILRLRPHITVE